MLKRLRWADEQVGHALRSLIGRGALRTKDYYFGNDRGGCWITVTDFARLVRSASQVQRSTILYPAHDTNEGDPDFTWLFAAYDRWRLLKTETAMAVRSLYLHHAHVCSGEEEAQDDFPKMPNDKWWKHHLRPAVVRKLRLKREELWLLPDSPSDNPNSLYDASQPAPWSGKPVISRTDQLWFRVEVAFSRPLRSDADCAEALVNYERSRPRLPPGTSLVALIAKQFNISELEVTGLRELGHSLRGHVTAKLAPWTSYVPVSHAWGLLSRFQEVCILNHQPPVREASCQIAVALMRCGLHLAENITFLTFLSQRLNFTRESTARFLAAQLAEHKRLLDSIPKLSPRALPHWAVAALPNVEIYTFEQEFDYVMHLAWIEEMLKYDDAGCASKMLDSTPVASRTDPRVLALKLQVQVTLKDWQGAWEIGQHLLRVQPDNIHNWVRASEALRHLPEGGLRQAYDLLLSAAKLKQHCRQAVVGFNLARFACQLQDLGLAGWWLNRAFDLEPGDKLKLAALDEPDLKPLWRVIESQLSEAARAARR